MAKILKRLKIIVYLLGIAVFYDLLQNPQRAQYAGANFNIIPNYYRIITAVALMVLMTLLALYEIFRSRLAHRFGSFITIVQILFTGAIYMDVSYCMRVFSYHQVNEYIITALITLPLAFVFTDLSWLVKLKTKYLLFSGLTLIIPTTIYFQLIYQPYEAYYNDVPIMFLHYNIRNWLCFAGLLLMAVALLRWAEQKHAKSEAPNQAIKL